MAFTLSVTVCFPAGLLAEGSETTEFGAVSPVMIDCFAEDTALAEECLETESLLGDERPYTGPLRITGEGSFGFDYDGERISPEHRLKIIFEFGGQTDDGLGIQSRISLPENPDDE